MSAEMMTVPSWVRKRAGDGVGSKISGWSVSCFFEGPLTDVGRLLHPAIDGRITDVVKALPFAAFGLLHPACPHLSCFGVEGLKVSLAKGKVERV